MYYTTNKSRYSTHIHDSKIPRMLCSRFWFHFWTSFLVRRMESQIADHRDSSTFNNFLSKTSPQTDILFKITAIGMLKNPVKTLNNHCEAVSGDVLAKVPRYSTIITWKITVAAITLTKTLFFHIPSKTSSFSISREFTSLKSCKIGKYQHMILEPC